MWYFDTDHKLWGVVKTMLASMTTVALYTTKEAERLVALYAKMASTAAFTADATKWRQADSQYLIGALKKAMSRRGDG